MTWEWSSSSCPMSLSRGGVVERILIETYFTLKIIELETDYILTIFNIEKLTTLLIFWLSPEDKCSDLHPSFGISCPLIRFIPQSVSRILPMKDDIKRNIFLNAKASLDEHGCQARYSTHWCHTLSTTSSYSQSVNQSSFMQM